MKTDDELARAYADEEMAGMPKGEQGGDHWGFFYLQWYGFKVLRASVERRSKVFAVDFARQSGYCGA